MTISPQCDSITSLWLYIMSVEQYHVCVKLSCLCDNITYYVCEYHLYVIVPPLCITSVWQYHVCLIVWGLCDSISGMWFVSKVLYSFSHCEYARDLEVHEIIRNISRCSILKTKHFNLQDKNKPLNLSRPTGCPRKKDFWNSLLAWIFSDA